MLKMLLYSFLVFAAEDHDRIRLSGNELLIYTDIKKENLKISFESKDTSEEIDLIDEKQKYYFEDLSSTSCIYSLTLPSEPEGRITYEVKGDEDKSLFKFHSSWKNETGFLLGELEKVKNQGDSEIFPYEANYTYVNIGARDRIICVISDSLVKKVQLDSQLEHYLVKNIVKECEKFKTFMMDTKSNLNFLKEHDKMSKEQISLVNNYMYGLLIEFINLYCSIVTLGSIYSDPVYSKSMVGFTGISIVKDLVSKTYESFYDGNEFIYETKLDKFEDYCSNDENKSDLQKFRESLETFVNDLSHMRNMFEKKELIEKAYSDKRNEKYFSSLDVKEEDRQNPQISLIRNNLEHYIALIYLRQYNESYKFVEHYVENMFGDKGDFESELKVVLAEYSRSFATYINLICLRYDVSGKYLDNLSTNVFLAEITPDSGLKFLNELQCRTKKFKECYSLEEKLFENVLQTLDNETKFWENVKKENTNVGLFQATPSDIKEAQSKVVKNDVIDQPLTNEGLEQVNKSEGKPVEADVDSKPVEKDTVGQQVKEDGEGKPVGEDTASQQAKEGSNGEGKPVEEDTVGQQSKEDSNGEGKPVEEDTVSQQAKEGSNGEGEPVEEDTVGQQSKEDSNGDCKPVEEDTVSQQAKEGSNGEGKAEVKDTARKPVEEDTVSQQVKEDGEGKPDVKDTASKPVEEDTVSQQAKEGSNGEGKPVGEDSAGKPVEEGIASKPVKEGSSSEGKPVEEGIASKPVKEGSSSEGKPVEEDTASKPAEEDTVSQQVKEDGEGKPDVKDTAINQAKEGSSSEGKPVEEDIASQQDKEDIASKPVEEDIASKPVKEDTVSQQDKEGSNGESKPEVNVNSGSQDDKDESGNSSEKKDETVKSSNENEAHVTSSNSSEPSKKAESSQPEDESDLLGNIIIAFVSIILVLLLAIIAIRVTIK